MKFGDKLNNRTVAFKTQVYLCEEGGCETSDCSAISHTFLPVKPLTARKTTKPTSLFKEKQ